MNCETYLSMLSTLPVEELAYGDAREHAATCRDCERVTRVVAERERNMLIAYGDVYAPVATEPYAAQAIELSRRRRVAFFYRIGLGIAMAATVVAMVAFGRTGASVSTRRSVTYKLHCLAPDQAAELLLASVPSTDHVSVRTDSNPAFIVISAPPRLMWRLLSVLKSNDAPTAAGCPVRIVTPAGPPPTR